MDGIFKVEASRSSEAADVLRKSMENRCVTQSSCPAHRAVKTFTATSIVLGPIHMNTIIATQSLQPSPNVIVVLGLPQSSP